MGSQLGCLDYYPVSQYGQIRECLWGTESNGSSQHAVREEGTMDPWTGITEQAGTKPREKPC